MALRTRRSNAGNRLQSLLAEQKPLDDADAAFFAERDDDEDFDLEAEEERLRQLKLKRGAANSDDEDEDEQSEKGGSGDEESGEDESEHDDSNFSDTTDDSELERDEDPADAGEKELQTEQRQRTKEQRVAERNKMFKIKVRPPREEESAPRPKKRRVFASADILLEKGRHSERKSALRNKHHLIEQMREAEQRRAQYVPPKRKKEPKLTQEQRLEEAKKTELRNLSSLNKFVELEEERKIQQRLAMLSRRPKITHFVRFHSSQFFEPPKLIEVVDPTAEDSVKSEFDPEHEHDASTPQPASQPTPQPTPQPGPTQPSSPGSATNERSADGEVAVKSEPGTEDPVKQEDGNDESVLKTEEADEVEEVPVYGPGNLRTYNFLTLHDFADVHINKYSIRSIVLGSIASASSMPPLKRMCPFSGQEAHYLDPKTGIAYRDLEANKLVKLVQEGRLGWSKELGGVFTQKASVQRPAKGVPEGFA